MMSTAVVILLHPKKKFLFWVSFLQQLEWMQVILLLWFEISFSDILVTTPNRLIYLLNQDPPAVDLSRSVTPEYKIDMSTATQ